MTHACECGMTVDRGSGRLGCAECGAAGCRSCVIKVDGTHYCRWCYPAVAGAR
jgi:hypothetical protein